MPIDANLLSRIQASVAGQHPANAFPIVVTPSPDDATEGERISQFVTTRGGKVLHIGHMTGTISTMLKASDILQLQDAFKLAEISLDEAGSLET